MAAEGVIKSKMVEIILNIIGVLLFIGLIFLGAGLGLLFNIPYFLVGLIVGFTALVVIVSGSFAVSKEEACTNCGSKQKVVRNIISYQCSVCGYRNRVAASAQHDR